MNFSYIRNFPKLFVIYEISIYDAEPLGRAASYRPDQIPPLISLCFEHTLLCRQREMRYTRYLRQNPHVPHCPLAARFLSATSVQRPTQANTRSSTPLSLI